MIGYFRNTKQEVTTIDFDHFQAPMNTGKKYNRLAQIHKLAKLPVK
jgi:hypothetical protein